MVGRPQSQSEKTEVGSTYILMESKSRVFETGNQTLSFLQLEEESAVHKDIVQGDFEDTYK